MDNAMPRPNCFPNEEYRFKPFKLSQHHFINSLTPKPRSGHRIVCDDKNVYSYGGYNPEPIHEDESDITNDSDWENSKPLFSELWKYNISTKMWKKLNVSGIPKVLVSNAAILSGNILMIYGGTGFPFGRDRGKDLYICDLKNEEDLKFEKIVTTGDSPPGLYGQAIVLLNCYLFTVGGTSGFDYTCDIHRLNLKDGRWEIVFKSSNGVADEPEGRYRHEIVYYDNKIYILGGGTATQSFGFMDVYAFNLVSQKWDKFHTHPDRTEYPNPRRCHSCVQQGHYAYIIGGLNGDSMYRSIWRLNLNTLNWEKFPTIFSMDSGCYFHSSCLTSYGKLITFGGIVQSGNVTRRTAAINSSWLCIPKLEEMSWEAIMFYYPMLHKVSEKELSTLGIPQEFIQRLNA